MADLPDSNPGKQIRDAFSGEKDARTQMRHEPESFRVAYESGYGLKEAGVPLGRFWKAHEFRKRFNNLRRTGACEQLRGFESLKACQNAISQWRKADAAPPQRHTFAPGVIRVFYDDATAEQTALWRRWVAHWDKEADERVIVRVGKEFDVLPPLPDSLQTFPELFEHALQKLNEKADRFSRTCVLQGDAGVGKSTAAAALVKELRGRESGSVRKHYWIKLRPDSTHEYETVGRDADLNGVLTRFARSLNVAFAGQREEERRAAIKEALIRTHASNHYIVVLDNLLDVRELEQFDISSNSGMLLATSLSADWNVGGRGIQVRVPRWSADTTRNYLAGSLPDLYPGHLTKSAVEELHSLLEGLPLALGQAAAFLKERGDVGTYISLFKARSADQLRAASLSDPNGRRSKTVYTTVSLLLDAICECRLPSLRNRDSQAALTLAFLVACAAPTGIQREVLQFILPDSWDRIYGSKALANLSLLTEWGEQEPSIAFHQLTHHVAREWFRETWQGWHASDKSDALGIFGSFVDVVEQLFQGACDRLVSQLTDEIREKDDWERTRLHTAIATVVLGIFDILSAAHVSPTLAGRLANLMRATAIATTRLFGYPETSPRLDWLCELSLGMGSPLLTYICRGCRASMVRDFARLPMAQREIETVLQGIEDSGDHIFRVKMLHSLAVVYYEQQLFDEAIRYVDIAAAEIERTQINSVSSKLDSMCLKAVILARCGDLDAAISLYDDAERVADGDGNPFVTAEAAYCRAGVLVKRGRIDDAAAVLQRVVRDLAPRAYQQRTLGSIFNSYGLVLAALGHQEEAQRYLTSGRSRLAKEYGRNSGVHSKQLVDVATFLMVSARKVAKHRTRNMRKIACSMIERSAIIVEKQDQDPSGAFYHHCEVAPVHILYGDYKSANEAARVARHAFERLNADARRLRLPRLLRIEAMVASEAGLHSKAVLLLKELRDARLVQYRCSPDPIEVLRDEMTAAQVHIRARVKSISETRLELDRIQVALLEYFRQDAPIFERLSEIRNRIDSSGDQAIPVAA